MHQSVIAVVASLPNTFHSLKKHLLSGSNNQSTHNEKVAPLTRLEMRRCGHLAKIFESRSSRRGLDSVLSDIMATSLGSKESRVRVVCRHLTGNKKSSGLACSDVWCGVFLFSDLNLIPSKLPYPVQLSRKMILSTPSDLAEMAERKRC